MADWNALMPDAAPTTPVVAPSINPLLPDSGVNSADAYTSTLGAVSDWVAKQRADASARGLWDDATGGPTQAGWLDALHQYGGALVASTSAPGGRGAPVPGQGAFDFAAPAAVAPVAAETGVGGAPISALIAHDPAVAPVAAVSPVAAPVVVAAPAVSDISSAGVGGAPVNPMLPPAITAYHGSGADFPAFSDQHIGSGEGAQAFGYGHYFAENESIARGYRDAVAGRLSAEDKAAYSAAATRGLDATRTMQGIEAQMLRESVERGNPMDPDWGELGVAIHPDVVAKYQPQMDAAVAAHDAARAEMSPYEVKAGPSVGGQSYNSYDPVHRAAFYLDRNGGDRAKTLAAIDAERAVAQAKAAPGMVSVAGRQLQQIGSGAHADAVRRLDEMKPLLAPDAAPLPAFKSPGHMYEVGINAQPEHFLDWDKPLSEQSQHVKDALGKLGYQTEPLKTWSDAQLMARASQHLNSNETLRDAANDIGTRRDVARLQAAWNNGPAEFRKALIDPDTPIWRREKILGKAFNPTGGELHQTMVDTARQDLRAQSLSAGELPDRGMVPAFVRDQLSDAGVAGIRYLDGSSRRAGEGASNHVVFNPSDIAILRKYGLAGLIAGGGAAAGAAQTTTTNPQQ